MRLRKMVRGVGFQVGTFYVFLATSIVDSGLADYHDIKNRFCGRASASRDPTTPTFPTSGRNGSATTATVPPIVTTSTIRQVTAAGEDDGDLL